MLLKRKYPNLLSYTLVQCISEYVKEIHYKNV